MIVFLSFSLFLYTRISWLFTYFLSAPNSPFLYSCCHSGTRILETVFPRLLCQLPFCQFCQLAAAEEDGRQEVGRSGFLHVYCPSCQCCPGLAIYPTSSSWLGPQSRHLPALPEPAASAPQRSQQQLDGTPSSWISAPSPQAVQ